MVSDSEMKDSFESLFSSVFGADAFSENAEGYENKTIDIAFGFFKVGFRAGIERHLFNNMMKEFSESKASIN